MADIKVVGVVGAGPMGTGIAQVALAAGYEVVLYHYRQERLPEAADEISKRLGRLVEKGRMPEGTVEDARKRLTLAKDLSAFGAADLVIEAIVEQLAPKQELFQKLEDIVSETAILATNTSSLSVAGIGLNCRNKRRVAGLHFFNPAPLMRLVEVIRAPATSDETVATLTEVSKKFGKTPVTVSDGPGFLVNLQGRAFSTEAMAIAHEGVADPATIDRILREGGGFRMGAFELMDMTGIDLNYPAAVAIFKGQHYDPRFKTTPGHALLWNAGLFGRKSGRGFHDYDPDAKPYEAPAGKEGTLSVTLPESAPGFDQLKNEGVLKEGGDTILVAPIGEDCAGICHRLKLDPAKTVAVDFTGLEKKHLTLMPTVGGDGRVEEVAAILRGNGYTVEIIKDSPGFVLQRIVAMIANLGCELAQTGVGSPEDIDTAMKLALNYPRGPLEWADFFGAETCYEIMRQLHEITGYDRYRPSLWLRRRALLGQSLYQQG